MTPKLGFAGRAFWVLCVLACTFLLLQFVSLYFNWQRQALVGAAMVVACLFLNRLNRGKLLTVALMLLSLAATLRYGWWRVRMVLNYFTNESNHRLSIDSVLMLILLGAEFYTVFIMLLGYMQTSQTLNRKPILMPADESLWPHVDVLIPTYNEPLSLVRYTALAAINMDYPPEKLHVAILDDGVRSEFREFAEAAGIGYVVREKHTHAKAGNINHALSTMTAPLVAIFDCDHVPCRSFLQCTVGWFLVEDKLAMLQTPHFFYSPDPFERNLLQYKDVPNEGELFYGVIQDGNDFWNATFFCGSCAVIRRNALEQVGGIATETVTEDAHTSLRMQKKGWNTAYINVPQAAGLATETLAAHVGQRVRWARGMVQILRTDNPLLARGMKLSQRVCYFNAMLHFLYAVPRLVFLVAPLCYMLFGRTIIPGYWLAILAYALPHLVLSSLTNSRIQGRHRHSFWNEIYETVLAPYILLPTLLALINPKLGKFNVTDKGTTLSDTVFDRKIAAPTTWLLGLLFLGMLATPYRLFVLDPGHPGVILSNLVWIVFNMVILGVAAAVAHEQKQRRASVRIPVSLPIQVLRENGAIIPGETCDMSVGGASIDLKLTDKLEPGETVQVMFPLQTGESKVPAQVIAQLDTVRLQFVDLSLEEEETLTCALYSRADSWLSVRGNVEADRPLLSLARVILLSFTGFKQVLLGLLPRKADSKKEEQPAGAPAGAVGTLAALTLAFLCAAVSLGQAPVSAANAAASSAQPAFNGTANAASPQLHTAIKLSDLGVMSTADLRGPHGYYSAHFTLPYTQLPRAATLTLHYQFSPDLRPGTGRLQIRLNNTAVKQLDATGAAGGQFQVEQITLPADLLIRENDLTFEFDGQARVSAGPPPVLLRLGSTSQIQIGADPVAFRNDLSLLPLPLFDSDVPAASNIVFAFLHVPDAQTLQAAGVLASWFGSLSSAIPPRFAVVTGYIPAGNVVVFATAADNLPTPLALPRGSSVQIVPNPNDNSGSVLVLGGDSGRDILTAAQSISMRKAGHITNGELPEPEGHLAQFSTVALPSPRQPDDAPRWLPADRLVSLATYSPQPLMRGDGSKPLPVYFRVAPDTYYGEAQNLSLHMHYRYNSRVVAPGSALRVILNGEMVSEAMLRSGSGPSDARREVLLPVANMRPFANTLLFNFDFQPLRRPGTTTDATLRELQGEILRDSALDLREANHYAAMPNLELFSNAGFPFTRLADLGQSSIVLPRKPTEAEIALFLQLMGHCGRQTGYPVLRVQVVTPEEMNREDRDYLVLGTVANQPAFATLDSVLPVTLAADGLRLRDVSVSTNPVVAAWHRAMRFAGLESSTNRIGGDDLAPADAVVQSVESPYGSGRTLVTIALRDDAAEPAFTARFLDKSQSSEISEAVSVLRGGKFQSFAADVATYHIGTVSRYMVMRIWLTQNFWLLMVGVFSASFLLALGVRRFLRVQTAARLHYPTLPDGSPAYRKLEPRRLT